MTKKFIQTIKTCFTNLMAYRLNLLLLVIGPALVFFLIKVQLWSSIFTHHSMINGYTLSMMIEYQFWVFLLGLLTQGFNSIHIADDIRLGRITQFLLYPFSFFHYNIAYFLAFFFIQFIICMLTMIMMCNAGLIDLIFSIQFLIGVAFALLVAWFWFQIQYLIGILAFWLEETWVMRVLVGLVAQFFSGSILPLEFYPQWLTKLLWLSPFPYITYFPVKLISASDIAFNQALQGAGILIIWSLLLYLLTHLIWRKGIRLYTAAGM